MNRTLLYNLFFLFSITIHAQSTLISGKIIVDDADEIINLDGFLIENTTTNARTKADENGLFSIKVNEGDELIFKQIGIIDRQIKISKNMINKGFIDVHVNIEVIELAETNIKPLKKYWKDNVSKEETQSQKINRSLGINEEFKNDLVKGYFVAGYLRSLGVTVRYENVIALLDQVSDKEIQRYKYFLKTTKKDKYDQILLLNNYFTDYYFINDLKIPKGNILQFLDYCYTDFKIGSLLKNNQFNQISLILEEQAPIYLNKTNLKPLLND